MTQYKILFLDVDGTIFPPDHTIQESTKNAIAQVQSMGIEVFIATGRPLHEMEDLAQQLNVKSFIGYNGAYATYHGQDLYQFPMEEPIVKQFLKVAKENQHEAVLYTNSSNAFTDLQSPFIKEFIKVFSLSKNHSYTPAIDHRVLGMTLINLRPGDTSLYTNNAGIRLSQVNIGNMQHCYDVIHERVNKGYGVNQVLQHLGIDKVQSIAFGDGMNDKEMLQSVGESFAMGNSHPDLFRYAKHKTTTVTNSGIYNGLKKIGLVE
ncbi:HAD family hydrolase [Neobacillus dielmonensis]|uniref:HAD family hydrolase n=1 Tax=Neobacillus dielmonensis TaxID=1347369 RepID=UPI0005A6385D|nr:HAD family hydrolase [Neobacillus dielmonensis]